MNIIRFIIEIEVDEELPITLGMKEQMLSEMEEVTAKLGYSIFDSLHEDDIV
jgi:hypothetical protein